MKPKGFPRPAPPGAVGSPSPVRGSRKGPPAQTRESGRRYRIVKRWALREGGAERSGGMRVTYVHHSGFLIETAARAYLFDYVSGALPPLRAERPVVVLASHAHRDHYDPGVFALLRSRGVRQICAVLSRGHSGNAAAVGRAGAARGAARDARAGAGDTAGDAALDGSRRGIFADDGGGRGLSCGRPERLDVGRRAGGGQPPHARALPAGDRPPCAGGGSTWRACRSTRGRRRTKRTGCCIFWRRWAQQRYTRCTTGTSRRSSPGFCRRTRSMPA